MVETRTTPKWARLQSSDTTCRICGQPLYANEEHEVVKPKDRRPTMYFRKECIKKEIGG